jgi:hypothetical protein
MKLKTRIMVNFKNKKIQKFNLLAKDKPCVEFFENISSVELETFIESNQTFRRMIAIQKYWELSSC